jgi:hypothetical protein
MLRLTITRRYKSFYVDLSHHLAMTPAASMDRGYPVVPQCGATSLTWTFSGLGS